jgi:DNA-binding FadR family transcriptional regulator
MGVMYGRVARTSAAEEVRGRLVELIEAGDLAVGEKLPAETALAHAFGVSRPVVREALGALRAAGMLRSRAGYGTVVAARRSDVLVLERHSYEELHEVRCNLEVPGVGQAARRRLPEHVERLAALIEQLEVAVVPQVWVDLDAAFHICLAEATGNRVQVRLVEDLRDLLMEQSLLAAEIPGRRDQANREHRGIYEAVAGENAVEARRGMKRHLDSVERSLRAKVRGRR